MELSTLSSVTNSEQAKRVADNVAATLCTRQSFTTDDILAAFEDGINPTFADCYPPVSVTFYPNVLEAIITLVNTEGAACVILTKDASLVVASAKEKGYIVFNVETKRFDYTLSPEYDVDIEAVSSVYLVTAEAKVKKAEKKPRKKKPKPIVEPEKVVITETPVTENLLINN